MIPIDYRIYNNHGPDVATNLQRESLDIPSGVKPDVRDQRQRALDAPLAERNFWEPLAVPASGVTTRDDRCIA